MSARGFGAVLSAGAVAGAALGFYLVSLKVASQRAQLEDVETSIAMTQRDIRLLQTELGTRGRLAQLERWNVNFIRLSAPSADQFVDSGFQLATLVKPEPKPVIGAPVVLASAPVGVARPSLGDDGGAPASRSVSEMVHVASYSIPQRFAPSRSALAGSPAKAMIATIKADSVKPPVVKPGKTAAATKPVKSATADPLAPLSKLSVAAKAGPLAAARGPAIKLHTKDFGSD